MFSKLLGRTPRKSGDKSSRSRRPGGLCWLPIHTWLAILSVLIMIVAFILSILCVFAGSKPGMMQDYALFTLNVSRIGDNLKEDLDRDIMSLHIKRSASLANSLATRTRAPTTLITIRPRGVGSDIASDFSKGTSEAHSLGHHASSDAASLAHHASSDIASHVTSAFGTVQSDLVHAVNEAYEGIISGLNLTDFYNIHIMTSCSGTYVTEEGTNITVGGNVLPDSGTHEHVDNCQRHSDLDPVQLIRVVYWIGIACTGLALTLAVIGIFSLRKWTAAGNVVVTAVAFCTIGLASAVINGLSAGAAKFVNFIGQDIGVAGYVGHKFLRLTWTVAGLLAFNGALWLIIAWLRHKERKKATESSARPHISGPMELQPRTNGLKFNDVFG